MQGMPPVVNAGDSKKVVEQVEQVEQTPQSRMNKGLRCSTFIYV